MVAEVLGKIAAGRRRLGPDLCARGRRGIADGNDCRGYRSEVSRDELAQRLSSRNFRAYTSSDVVGVEIGGAVKNVLAIGAAMSDGLGFGANTRIALITRGLVEMTRLGCRAWRAP